MAACRGYRGPLHRAGLNEAAAAGILTLAGWPYRAGGFPFVWGLQTCFGGPALYNPAGVLLE